jgi:hypothetical protein
VSITSGTGPVGGGTGLIRHPQLFKGLWMGPALATGFSGLVYLADYQQAKKYDMSVADYRTAIADKLSFGFLFPLLFESLTLSSSGGGGPGESLTSTDTPPALHRQGQPVPVVVPAASNSAHGGRRSGAKARKKCPRGFRWSPENRRCVPKRWTREYEHLVSYSRKG